MRDLGSPRQAVGALVRKTAIVFTHPGGTEIERFGLTDVNGQHTVFGVTAVHIGNSCTRDWYRVQLSSMPNGGTGWIRAWTVSTFKVSSRIVVDLSSRMLRLYRSGKLVLTTPVGVGTPDTPTPVGRFFVNERYVLSSAGGPYGPAALGISAHSNVLHSWTQDGPIGLHGTDEPWSIGHASSHGCVRLPNDAMQRLFPLTQLGTPVVVHR